MATAEERDFEATLQANDSESESSGDSDDGEEIELSGSALSSALLNEVLQKIPNDESVTRCSLGSNVCDAVRRCVLHIDSSAMKDFAAVIVREMERLLPSNKNKVKLSNFWRKFHILRLSKTISCAWEVCATSFGIDELSKHITLQVILKRMVTGIISRKIEVHDSSSFIQIQQMTEREENVVRFMAGYVLLKLKKKFPEHSNLFESFRTGIQMDIDFAVDVHDYTRIWSEQIDRGSLNHVTDAFYNLIEALENICRRHLDVRHAPTEDIFSKILVDCNQNTHITRSWGSLTNDLIAPVNKQKVLHFIITLWAKIRVHSFTRRLSDIIANSQSKSGVRKTLKRKGTDKDTT